MFARLFWLFICFVLFSASPNPLNSGLKHSVEIYPNITHVLRSPNKASQADYRTWPRRSLFMDFLPIQSFLFYLYRLNDPKMSEAERQSMESERADRSLFVQELLLSTLVREESSSSDEDDRGEMADFGAMGCVDIMPLDVALENLNLKESNKGNEPPPPPL